MAKPEVYQDYLKLQEIQQHIETLKSNLSTAYEEWEALAE
ncbi:ABC transporter C-terminal domain-containing protein [Mycobacterium tuberculosis]